MGEPGRHARERLGDTPESLARERDKRRFESLLPVEDKEDPFAAFDSKNWDEFDWFPWGPDAGLANTKRKLAK